MADAEDTLFDGARQLAAQRGDVVGEVRAPSLHGAALGFEKLDGVARAQPSHRAPTGARSVTGAEDDSLGRSLACFGVLSFLT